MYYRLSGVAERRSDAVDRGGVREPTRPDSARRCADGRRAGRATPGSRGRHLVDSLCAAFRMASAGMGGRRPDRPFVGPAMWFRVRRRARPSKPTRTGERTSAGSISVLTGSSIGSPELQRVVAIQSVAAPIQPVRSGLGYRHPCAVAAATTTRMRIHLFTKSRLHWLLLACNICTVKDQFLARRLDRRVRRAGRSSSAARCRTLRCSVSTFNGQARARSFWRRGRRWSSSRWLRRW